MILTPDEARKKECRKVGGPLLQQGIGGAQITGWAFPYCSADKCMDWRWDTANTGFCGRGGVPFPVVDNGQKAN